MSDNFGATLDDRTENRGKFRKTNWLKLTPGEHTVRILDSQETKIYGHYFVGRGWVVCLSEECPVCQNNKKILYEHPEDYREVAGWNPRRARFFLNVLDRADNTVKVLGCGPQLIEDIKVMSKAVRDQQDERVDIRAYDWVLISRGEGRDKDVTPTPRYYGQATDVAYNTEDLYDLDNCMVKLTPEETLDVFNGASIKDVFSLRRAKAQVLNSDEVKLSEDVSASIQDAVDQMFNK